MSGFLSHVSENASETQIDNTMTFTVVVVSIEQNEEFQESKIGRGGGGGSLAQEGGFRNPWNPPLATLLQHHVTSKILHEQFGCFQI